MMIYCFHEILPRKYSNWTKLKIAIDHNTNEEHVICEHHRFPFIFHRSNRLTLLLVSSTLKHSQKLINELDIRAKTMFWLNSSRNIHLMWFRISWLALSIYWNKSILRAIWHWFIFQIIAKFIWVTYVHMLHAMTLKRNSL